MVHTADQQVDTLHVLPANREHFFPVPDHESKQLNCFDSCAIWPSDLKNPSHT